MYDRIQIENLTFPVAVDDLVFKIAVRRDWSGEDAVFDVSVDANRCPREDDGVFDAVTGDGCAFSDHNWTNRFALDGGGWVNVISAGEEEAGFEVGVEGSGVEPGSFELARKDGFALIDEGLDGIRDLVFAPCRGLEGGKNGPDLRSKEVETGHGEVGFRVLRLFHKLDDTIAFDIGNSEPRGIFDGHDEVEVGATGGLELVFEFCEGAVVDGISEVQHEGVSGDEFFGEADGVGEAFGLGLAHKGKLDVELGAIAEALAHGGFVFADDDADFGDPHLLHAVEGVLHRHSVCQREERLGDDVGDGVEATSFSGGEDQSFHRLRKDTGFLCYPRFMPRIGVLVFGLFLCLVGCGRKEAVKFSFWASEPSARPLSGSYARMVQIGEAVEQQARAKAFYKGKPTPPITTRTAFFDKEKKQANAIIGGQKSALIGILGSKIEFHYQPVGLAEPPVYLRGIRLIGESMLWDMEAALAAQKPDGAIVRCGQLTRLGSQLLGGGAYEATLGISLIDRARAILAPELGQLGAGQLGVLAKHISGSISARPPLTVCLANETENMLLALQQAQDIAQSGDFKKLEEKLGKSTHDEVSLLESVSRDPAKVSSVFDWIGDDIKARGKWHVEQMQKPDADNPPPELQNRKNWRVLYRYFASNLDSLSPYVKKCAARTQLFMLECYLRQKVKLKAPLPKSLDAFSVAATRDPFTGKPFYYKSGAFEFKVYSAGSDGIDDGGQSNTSFDSPDLVLEHKL